MTHAVVDASPRTPHHDAPPRHIVVTGASGYIGTRLVELAARQGIGVTLLSRSAGPAGGARRLPWALGQPLPAAALQPDIPPDRQAVIHLAHDWRNTPAGDATEEGLNLEGTRALLHASRALSVGRFVFVSSQSARQDAANVYGRAKWAIEQLLTEPGEVAARVGLVYGGPPRAMFGMLSRLTGLTPVLPMIDPWREVQPIHLDEVCQGLLLLCGRRHSGWVGLAGPEGVGFGAFLRSLGRELHGRRLRILPIPLRLALLGCDVSAAIPFGPTVDRERVLGLAGTRRMECAGHLAALGLAVSPLEAGLRREPASRRALLAEGRALLSSVLREAPGNGLVRRYARAIAGSATPGPMAMSAVLVRWPGLIRFAEPVRGASLLKRRLALAATLAAASPQGFEGLARHGRTRRLLALGAGLAVEAVALPVRLVIGSRAP